MYSGTLHSMALCILVHYTDRSSTLNRRSKTYSRIIQDIEVIYVSSCQSYLKKSRRVRTYAENA